jgi:hypothetical protein
MLPISGNSASAGKKPTAPTIGAATAGNASASVAFTPSTYIGKDTITYTATSNPGGFTGSGSSSPITVSGLSNGTQYTFTVSGTTNYGVSSDASAFSSPVTPTVTYSVAPNSTSVNEGATVTFTVTTTNFGSGTLYWTLEGVSGTINNADFSSPANAVTSGGSVSISGNTGSFAVVLSNDVTTEGAESFRANLRTGSTTGTVVATSSTVAVADTSITPAIQIINEIQIINSIQIINTQIQIINTQIQIINTQIQIINTPLCPGTETAVYGRICNCSPYCGVPFTCGSQGACEWPSVFAEGPECFYACIQF